MDGGSIELLGGGPWLPCRCGVGAAPSARAPSPFLALRWRVGSASSQSPALFRRGQERSLRSDCMVGSDLWAQDGARLVALSYQLGRYHHLGLGCAVCGRALIRAMEMAPDAPSANRNSRPPAHPNCLTALPRLS